MPTSPSNSGAGTAGYRFESVLQEYFACGAISVDPEGKVVALTPNAERLLRLPDAQKLPRTFASLPTPIQSIIGQVRKTGCPVTDREIVFESNGAVPVALSISAMPVPPGEAAGCVVALFRDISSAGTLEYEMRRLNRLATIGTLSASMAHEVKNAMVPVRTFVGLLLEKNPDAELAGTVRREMERMDSIVGRMLKFSAPAKPNFSLVRLHELLDHSLRLVQHRVEGKLISLNRQFNAEPDSFSGDDHQLEQAFLNLLLNAVESMGVEGALTVSTDVVTKDARLDRREAEEASGFLRVGITDTGAGIPPENIEAIFKPFFTTKQTGTGLGLAVTRNIIEEHRGVIRVESQPGKGTTFTVFLPCAAPAAG